MTKQPADVWMVGVWVTIALGVVHAGTNPITEDGAPCPSWYEESFIHTHHSAGRPAPEWEEQFAAVRPDAVQFHGGAYAAGKRLSRAFEFAMVCTLNRSGSWSDIRAVVESLPAEEQALFYRRVNPDGSYAGRVRGGEVQPHVCYYSPGIPKHIFPIYGTVTRNHRPHQIWIDHTVITVNLCYCPVCRDAFTQALGAPPPERVDDPYWDEWVAHHRRGFEQWMSGVQAETASMDPHTIVTFNHAYFLAQPEPPPSFIKNLSADIHSSPLLLCLYARYASTVGLPFDLMPGLTDFWAGTVPKTVEEVVQTAAVITANGGRWNIGEFPASRDRQPADAMLALAVAGTEFVRARQPWTHRTEAVPLVAVLQSASTQYARIIPRPRFVRKGADEGEYVVSDSGMMEFIGSDNPGATRIYFHNNHSVPPEVLGAGVALLEQNIPFDIINETTLRERLEEYRLLVVSDQFRLEAETVERIRRFVEQGGSVLATGRTVESLLAPVLGVRLRTRAPLDHVMLELAGESHAVHAPLAVALEGAEVVARFSNGSNDPAVTHRALGHGRLMYVAADIFHWYHERSPYSPWSRTRVGHTAVMQEVSNWLAQVAPDLGYTCSAPPWVEVALRTRGDDLLIHLVERTFEWRNDILPVDAPIELTLPLAARPADVRLQPGAREIMWAWNEGALTLAVPMDEIDTHAIVEVKR